MLWLDISTAQGPNMHLDLCGKKKSVLIIIVSTQRGPEMALDMSGQEEPLLLLEVSTLKLHLE